MKRTSLIDVEVDLGERELRWTSGGVFFLFALFGCEGEKKKQKPEGGDDNCAVILDRCHCAGPGEITQKQDDSRCEKPDAGGFMEPPEGEGGQWGVWY